LGSLFYGTILGIFLIAFYFKNIHGTATFYAAIIAEIVVLILFFLDAVPYLWFNFIGCIIVIVIGFIFQSFTKQKQV